MHDGEALPLCDLFLGIRAEAIVKRRQDLIGFHQRHTHFLLLLFVKPSHILHTATKKGYPIYWAQN